MPDAFCCNSVIKACSSLKQQLRVFEDMQRQGPSPDVATHGALMTALGREHHWEKCVAMLEEMISQHLESNVIVYGAAISACDKASQWQNAVALLRNLHDERHAASLVCCSAVRR